jgi:hypothetical protein
VFGCGYRRIADASCSATTLGRRRDEWLDTGVANQLRLAVLGAYDRMLGFGERVLPGEQAELVGLLNCVAAGRHTELLVDRPRLGPDGVG